MQAAAASQQTSEARLVDEHFMKTNLSQMSTKSEPAAYSLYGYQSQALPHKYVSKDQLQQQLCKEEKLDKFSPKSLTVKDVQRVSQATPPRAATTSAKPASSHASYSSQLIQEGLIPNPAYASTNTTSNSMSALVNMSMYAGSHIPDRFTKEKSPVVKSEPVALPRSSHSQLPLVSSTGGSSIGTSFKSFVETAITQAYYKDIEEQRSKVVSPTRSPPMAATASIKSEKLSNGAADTDSDTLSAPSPTLSVKADGHGSKPCHPKMKLKKEWLQRHTEGGTACPNSSSSPTSAASGTLLNSSNASNLSETTTSASETESEQQVISHTI